MSSVSDQIITAPVNEFCILTGLGRTKIYEMLNSGELESVTIGRRRLIIVDSYRRLLNAYRGTPAEQPAPNAPKPSRRTRSSRGAEARA